MDNCPCRSHFRYDKKSEDLKLEEIVRWCDIYFQMNFDNEIKRAILTMKYDNKNIKGIIIHHFGTRPFCVCILMKLIRLKLYRRIVHVIEKKKFARVHLPVHETKHIILFYWKLLNCSFYYSPTWSWNMRSIQTQNKWVRNGWGF